VVENLGYNIRAMANFSTWTEAYASMLDDLAAGNSKVGSVTVGDKVLRYRTHDDFLNLLNHAKTQAGIDSGAVSLRVYAKNGGRASS